MKMEGDKNTAPPAADIQPDGQTKGFNQPNKEETHARLPKHTQKHANETVGSETTRARTHAHTSRVSVSLLLIFLSPPLDSFTHLLPEKAAGVGLQTAPEHWGEMNQQTGPRRLPAC